MKIHIHRQISSSSFAFSSTFISILCVCADKLPLKKSHKNNNQLEPLKISYSSIKKTKEKIKRWMILDINMVNGSESFKKNERNDEWCLSCQEKHKRNDFLLRGTTQNLKKECCWGKATILKRNCVSWWIKNWDTWWLLEWMKGRAVKFNLGKGFELGLKAGLRRK